MKPSLTRIHAVSTIILKQQLLAIKDDTMYDRYSNTCYMMSDRAGRGIIPTIIVSAYCDMTRSILISV